MFINLSLWVLLFPLLGFIILGVAGRAMPRGVVATIACVAVGLAFLFALSSFLSMLGTPATGGGRVNDQVIYTWVVSGDFQLSLGLLLDPLSATMLLVITGVGLLIHLYSVGYMEDDPSFWRFFSFLNFFIFAMVLLVSADNFLFLLVGWGLVGLASFLLIGFWFQKRSAVAAAQKAFVINVIGDFGLMLAIFLIFVHFGTLNYTTSDMMGVFDKIAASPTSANAICLLLFLACAAKSAQLPLYMWLPDAMEGPTPVSALIHAATMVTAGVYLVARAHPLFEQSAIALNTVAGIGGATALFAATIALFQLDIKRVLAYSTISQLGYMFMSEGVHNYSAGIFHLTTHAYFKALLFLGAGAVIHSLGGEQDMREMGGLRKSLPITFWTFLVAALAISGIPPLAGFWSKDEILGSLLAQATASHSPWIYVLWGVGLLTAALTAFYMFRLVFGIFTGEYRGTGPAKHGQAGKEGEEDEEESTTNLYRGNAWLPHIHEAPGVMIVPLILLAALTVLGGFVGSFAIFGRASWQPLTNFLDPVFTQFTHVKTPVGSLPLEWLSTGLSVGLGLLGILGAWAIYRRGFHYKESKNPLYQFVLHKYYVDEILTVALIRPVLWIARIATRWLEDSTLDGGSRGVALILRGTSAGLRRVQTGYMRNYALAILVGVILIVVYYAVMRG